MKIDRAVGEDSPEIIPCAQDWWKLDVFLRTDILNICGSGAWLNSTWCFCQWTLRYSFQPMPGEERLGSWVYLGWWNMLLPRTCPDTARMSNTGNSFLTFENFQTKFHSVLCIFWYSIFLYSRDYRFRNAGKTRVYAGHFFVWITHYSLGREWIILISQR